MVTLFILILLAIAFYSGARRGLTLQLVYTVGYFISYLAAKHYYKDLAPKLELYIPYPSVTENSQLVFFTKEMGLELDQAYYAAIAFLLILFFGWILTRFVGIFAHSLTYLPILRQFDWIAGGLLSVVLMYVGIFLVLTLLTLLPVDFIQNLFKDSGVARGIVENTPIFSNQIQNLWVNNILK
ncbi:colicin V production protein CvpA [Enterococcus sp. JM4C]|uniref:CvpA family protein n=1 Tax=Candidatus Enterococcus huntleyi TaxID=1857217 RepID=UPI00137AE958|nr:CvpA family protein [Enterococcus sp. JM4C]KAF1295704.1 colicin V production protein CvpA [Enterococcus sp. JM4C]